MWVLFDSYLFRKNSYTFTHFKHLVSASFIFYESYVNVYGSYFETSVRKLYCLRDQGDARGHEQEAGRAAANR